MLLLGRTITAADAHKRFGLYVLVFPPELGAYIADGCRNLLFSVNDVVPSAEVLSTALAVAKEVVANSPDAVQSTKEALLLSQKHNFDEAFKMHVGSSVSTRVYKGDNIKVRTFSHLLTPRTHY